MEKGKGGRREIGKDDKSKDGESFGNKGIASCPVSYRIDLLNEDLLLILEFYVYRDGEIFF